MAPLAPGVDVESYCSRCKMDLMHVVVAMVGTRPRRVRCRTCGSEHFYHPPQRLKTAARPALRPARRARRQPAPVRLVLEPDPAVSRSYCPAGDFREGEVLHHFKFGYGVVERRLSDGKIEVRFTSGPRLLVINQIASPEPAGQPSGADA
jgi:hypothetical protein